MAKKINLKFALQLLLETVVWCPEVIYKLFRGLVPAFMFAVYLKVFEVEPTAFLSFVILMIMFGGLAHHFRILNLIKDIFGEWRE